MVNLCRRQRIRFTEAVKLLPGKRFALATPVKVAKHNAPGLADERVERLAIKGHPIVLDMPTQLGLEQPPDLLQR